MAAFLGDTNSLTDSTAPHMRIERECLRVLFSYKRIPNVVAHFAEDKLWPKGEPKKNQTIVTCYKTPKFCSQEFGRVGTGDKGRLASLQVKREMPPSVSIVQVEQPDRLSENASAEFE